MTSVSEEEAFSVATAMTKYGGSFFKRLGSALLFADYHNRQRIKETWPSEWKKYLDMSEAEEENTRATTSIH